MSSANGEETDGFEAIFHKDFHIYYIYALGATTVLFCLSTVFLSFCLLCKRKCKRCYTSSCKRCYTCSCTRKRRPERRKAVDLFIEYDLDSPIVSASTPNLSDWASSQAESALRTTEATDTPVVEMRRSLSFTDLVGLSRQRRRPPSPPVVGPGSVWNALAARALPADPRPVPMPAPRKNNKMFTAGEQMCEYYDRQPSTFRSDNTPAAMMLAEPTPMYQELNKRSVVVPPKYELLNIPPKKK